MHTYKKIKALGTDIEIFLQSDKMLNLESDMAEIEKLFSDFEQSFSRFLTNSELSRLNKAPADFQASAELVRILQIAQLYYCKTNGIFDPTILQSLEHIGYNKSFPFSAFDSTSGTDSFYYNHGFAKLLVNKKTGIISNPEHLKIDLGGIGKGYITDKAVNIVRAKGYENFWISAGGDMFLSGRTQSIGVQNPRQLNEELFDIKVIGESLAVATSGIGKRQWQKDGRTLHHLIDPRNGTSAANDLLAVTIVAKTVTEADIFAKTAFILGPEKGLDFINKQKNVEGLMIDKNLQVILSRQMGQYLTNQNII